jgi:hypothetical protein
MTLFKDRMHAKITLSPNLRNLTESFAKKTIDQFDMLLGNPRRIDTSLLGGSK